MTPPGAVIFDMDGVLVDTEPLHLRATQATLGSRGGSYTARDNQAFFGATDPEMLRVLRILFGLPQSTAELVEAHTAHLVELIRVEARPLPGVPDVPLWLRKSGVRLGLATADHQPHALRPGAGQGPGQGGDLLAGGLEILLPELAMAGIAQPHGAVRGPFSGDDGHGAHGAGEVMAMGDDVKRNATSG